MQGVHVWIASLVYSSEFWKYDLTNCPIDKIFGFKSTRHTREFVERRFVVLAFSLENRRVESIVKYEKSFPVKTCTPILRFSFHPR